MKGSEAGPAALSEFARSAESVLERRVRNSPPERNEKKFLPGWKNRIKTYGPENIESYTRGVYMPDAPQSAAGRVLGGIYRNLVCGLM
jgi:hypothetical protein